MLQQGGFFQGAEQEACHIAESLGSAEVYLSAAELVDGFGQQSGDVGGSLQSEDGETGRHDDVVSFTAGGFFSYLSYLGLFVLLLGVVKKAIGFAGFDIGVAAGADLADVSAAGVLVSTSAFFISIFS